MRLDVVLSSLMHCQSDFCSLALEHNMGVRGDECALTCRSMIFGRLTLPYRTGQDRAV
jgi:hypothetical protein